MQQSTLNRFEDNGPTGLLPGTDVLTANGFRRVEELEGEHKIAVRGDGGVIDFSRPATVSSTEYEGVLYEFKHKYIDLRVPPGHTLWYQHTHSKSKGFGDWLFEPVESAVSRISEGITTGVRFCRQSDWVGEVPQTIPLPGSRPIQNNTYDQQSAPLGDFIEFLGWYLGDGYTGAYDHSVRGIAYVVGVRPGVDNIHHVKSLTDSIGLTSRILEYESPVLNIQSQQLHEALRDLGGSKEKHIPRWVMALPKSHLKSLYDGLLGSDGCHDSRSRERGNPYHQFVWSSRRLASDLHEVAHKLGRVGYFNKIAKHSGYKDDGDYWKVNVYDSNSRPAVTEFDQTTYSGLLYSLDIPQPIFARQGGRALWLGAQ